MDNPIQVEALTKSYGSFPAVKGIDFEVRAGEVFGMLGPNGAGKTTTVEILEGLRTRSGGRVIAQSIAFVYAPGAGMCDENDPLDTAAAPLRQFTVQGIVALEREVLQMAGIAGVALRYGYFYGAGTWYDAAPKPPSVHADASRRIARDRQGKRCLQYC